MKITVREEVEVSYRRGKMVLLEFWMEDRFVGELHVTPYEWYRLNQGLRGMVEQRIELPDTDEVRGQLTEEELRIRQEE